MTPEGAVDNLTNMADVDTDITPIPTNIYGFIIGLFIIYSPNFYIYAITSFYFD